MLTVDTFETLDFAYDIIDELNKNNIKYICIFIQSGHKRNKVKTIYSKFTPKEFHGYVQNVVVFSIQNLKSGYIKSSNPVLQVKTNILKQLNIQFILLMIKNENLEVSFYLDDKEGLVFASNVLASIPGKIAEELSEGEDNGAST